MSDELRHYFRRCLASCYFFCLLTSVQADCCHTWDMPAPTIWNGREHEGSRAARDGSMGILTRPVGFFDYIGDTGDTRNQPEAAGSFGWSKSKLPRFIHPDRSEARVHASGINFDTGRVGHVNFLFEVYESGTQVYIPAPDNPHYALFVPSTLLIFSHLLKMGSAQSTLTPETVLTAAVVVGGAVAIGYSTLAPGSSSSAESAAKKSKRKSTAAAGITVKSPPTFPPTASGLLRQQIWIWI
ncbi:hypothetical protein B0H14DRAFT_3572341 [Mycena olivaceomarginata]|nr:hypothetical protein B0H14DRAFT_3572341 [Mycena olivaceomarginata]